MVVGDPAIGADGAANPGVYELLASTVLSPSPDRMWISCPICGTNPTEFTVVELYRTPSGLHMQMMVMHPGVRGEPSGCYWSVPVNQNQWQASAPRVGPLSDVDTQPGLE